MRLYDKISIPFVSRIIYGMVMGLLLLNIVVLATLPWIISRVIRIEIGYGYASIEHSFGMYVYFLTMLYLSGGCAFLILNDLRLIFKSCIQEEVFIRANVTRLYRMTIFIFIIAVIFFSKLFVVNSIMTMIIVFVFFMADVFCFVIALLFDQAVDYKEEIDLTI